MYVVARDAHGDLAIYEAPVNSESQHLYWLKFEDEETTLAFGKWPGISKDRTIAWTPQQAVERYLTEAQGRFDALKRQMIQARQDIADALSLKEALE